MPTNHVRKRNRPLFDLPESHPARRFLEAFIECRKSCIGLEVGGSGWEGFDQEWHSEVDQRVWKYSAFAYMFLAFDIELDGWLTGAPQLTPGEEDMLKKLPYWHTLIRECRAAAIKDHHINMVLVTSKVEEVLDLWQICIETRARALADSGECPRS